MFKCQSCNRTSAPKEKQTTVVVERYEYIEGSQIKKEIKICESCVLEFHIVRVTHIPLNDEIPQF